MLIMLVSYVSSIIRGATEPTLMTWIFFCIAVALSFTTYMKTKEHSLLNNIANFVDLGFVGIITATIIGVIIYKHIGIKINIFECVCIFFTLIILFFWVKKHSSDFQFLTQSKLLLCFLRSFVSLTVRRRGIEPPRLAAYEPQSYAYTSSATGA